VKRANTELKRRTKVFGTFSNEELLLWQADPILTKIYEEWVSGREGI